MAREAGSSIAACAWFCKASALSSDCFSTASPA